MANIALDVANMVTIISSILLGLFVLNWVITFYLLREVDIIRTRKPKMCLLVGITSLIVFFYERPMFILQVNSAHYSTFRFQGWVLVTSLVFWFVVLPQPYFLVYRAFTVYADIKFINALKDKQWKSYLNPNEKNRWLTYRKYVIKLCLILLCVAWCVMAFPGVMLTFIEGECRTLCMFLTFMVAMIPLIFNCVLCCKIPKFNDFYGVRKEIMILLIAQIAGQTAYFVVITLFLPVTVRYSFGMLFLGQMGIILIFVYNCVLFAKVFHQFKLPWNVWQAQKYLANKHNLQQLTLIDTSASQISSSAGGLRMVPANSPVSPQLSTVSSASSTPAQKFKKVTLEQILENEETFSLFARDLSRSWSIENLLFFVETQEFLLSLKHKIELSDGNDSKCNDCMLDVKLAKNVPTSTLVIDNNEKTESNVFYKEAAEIFQKYIPTHSEFAINISSHCRNELLGKFGKENDVNVRIENIRKHTNDELKELFQVFGEARTQIYSVLKSLAVKFRTSEAYQRLIITVE